MPGAESARRIIDTRTSPEILSDGDRLSNSHIRFWEICTPPPIKMSRNHSPQAPGSHFAIACLVLETPRQIELTLLLAFVAVLSPGCDISTNGPSRIATEAVPIDPVDTSPTTPYLMKTSPYAVCTVHPRGDTDPQHSLRTFATWEGNVRFYGSGPGLSTAGLVLDCDSNRGETLVSQAVDSTAIAASAPLTSSTPPESSILPALTGDPLSWSQEELMQRGYPLRPDPQEAPASYSRWLQSVSKPMVIIPAKGIADPDGVKANTASNNWDGVLLPKYSSTDVYSNVSGFFYQPNIQSHGWQHIANTNYMFMFVGLDGMYGSADVAQAGTRSKLVTAWNGSLWYSVASYYAFAEWAPDVLNVLPDVVVYPGNYYYANVWMSDSTGGSWQPNGYLWFYFTQEDDGPSVRGCIGPPGGACTLTTGSYHQPFVGDSAEWIIEQPVLGQAMVDFYSAQMQAADAYRSDESPHNMHCDGNQIYNAVNLVKFGVGNTQATSDAIGGATSGGVVNFHWFTY